MTLLDRRDDPEILDRLGKACATAVSVEVLDASMAHVEAVDRWLGGARALRRHLTRLLPKRSETPVRILDIGTGNGVLLRRLVRRLGAGGLPCIGIGLELDPTILATARRAGREGAERDVALVRGDGLRLPLADRSVDVALTTLTLHHFDDTAAVALLVEMGRVARRGVIVSDLERSIPAWIGAHLLALSVWRGNPVTRHDGPLSVLRSFTPSELRSIGRRAGLGSVRVSRHPLFRLILEGCR